MDSTVPTLGSFEILDLRGILSEDFDAHLVNRIVIMCLRTASPDGGRVSLAEIRSVLQEDVPGQAVERIIMALRLHQLHSAGETRLSTPCFLVLPQRASPSFPRGGPKSSPSCAILGFPMVWAPPPQKTQEIANMAQSSFSEEVNRECRRHYRWQSC